VSLLAYEEAARLYELALNLVHEGVEQCLLLLALGDAQSRAGDTQASKESFREAAALAEKLGLAKTMAEAALGYGGRIFWEVSRGDEHHMALLERALSVLGEEDSALRVKLLARLAAGPLRDASFPPERRAALSNEALEMARRIGDPALLAYALHGHIEAALLSPDRAQERLELSAELIEAALAAGEKEPAVEGREERLLTLLGLGDRRGAEVELAAMEKLTEELRQPAHRWLVAVLQALLALLDGRLAEAEELVAEARRVGERTQTWNVSVSYGLQLVILRRDQGRLSEVEDLIRSSADRYPTYVIWRCVLASAAGELGDETRARVELEALAVDGFAPIPFDEQWLVSLSFLAEAAAVLADRTRAAALHKLLLPFADRVAVSYPEISTGSVARSLGLLASTTKRWEDAERHFAAAVEMNERIGARPWLARTQRDYVRMLRERGAPGDRERASALEQAARALADEIGMRLPS
jgi:tetratricopeptide (TPR) repeat protein